MRFDPNTQNQQSKEYSIETLYHLYQWIQSELAVLSLSKEQRQAEAKWIIEHAFDTKYSHHQINTLDDSEVLLEQHDAQLERIQHWVTERVQNRTPLQYCLNEAWFFGRPFFVTPAVLIPRPETELLVEWAWTEIKARGWRTIADIGTGSGCIAISLALLAKQYNIPLQIWATDISEEALNIAKQNAQSHHALIQIFQGNGLQALDQLGHQVDLILSNPPYIDLKQIETLAPEIRNHEPHQALFAENDGLYFYQQFAQHAAHYLNQHGGLMCEIGAEMGSSLKELFNQSQWRNVQIKPDYAQLDRIIFACPPFRA